MDENDIRRIIREERDKERTIHIEISGLEPHDFFRLRKSLKKHVFKMATVIPCIISVKDDEGVDIRKKDGW